MNQTLVGLAHCSPLQASLLGSLNCLRVKGLSTGCPARLLATLAETFV